MAEQGEVSVCPSLRPSICPSLRPSIHPPVSVPPSCCRQVLAQAWPFFGQYMEKLLVENIAPSIRASNTHLQTFTFTKVDMGEKVGLPSGPGGGCVSPPTAPQSLPPPMAHCCPPPSASPGPGGEGSPRRPQEADPAGPQHQVSGRSHPCGEGARSQSPAHPPPTPVLGTPSVQQMLELPLAGEGQGGVMAKTTPQLLRCVSAATWVMSRSTWR